MDISQHEGLEAAAARLAAARDTVASQHPSPILDRLVDLQNI